ncbi:MULTISPECIES: sensor histidine kinase [Sphingobacterium]|nr:MULTISPECIES: HAMP domain-containing sensor histidine kinase [Sphingobacterium]
MNFLRKVIVQISELYERIILTGVSDDISFLLRKEIKMVNTIALFSTIIIFIYGLYNIIHFPFIGILNFICVASILYCFRLNGQQKHQIAKSWILIVFAFVLISVNLISPNTTEYYLIIVLTIGLLVFKQKRTKISVFVLVSLAVLIPKFYVYQFPFMEDVGKDRLILNSALGLLFLTALVLYHQSIQNKYQDHIKEQSLKILQLNNDLKHLLAVIAHDIHSPLQATSMMMDYIANEKIETENRENSLLLVNKQLKSLRSNLDNLLEWSRMNMGGIQPKKDKILLHNLILNAVESFEVRRSEKGIKIISEIHPSASIVADPIQISIVLRNLLDNAIKFSHSGTNILISTKEAPSAVELCIKDEGKGMSESQIQNLFQGVGEPSYGTFGEKGTGLGLVLVKELVEANNGAIKVHSQEKVGTTFLIQFPK